MGPIGFKELVVILIVVLLIFGAKKLKTIGSDLGAVVHRLQTTQGRRRIFRFRQDAEHGKERSQGLSVRAGRSRVQAQRRAAEFPCSR